MLAGYYSIASGMMSQQKRLDVIGNNIVNSQTPGYRADRVVFSTFEYELALRQEAYASGQIGSSAPITLVDSVPTLFDSGNLKPTDQPTDMAINGEGFFNLQTSDEQGAATILTRNGQFEIDDEGYLCLPGIGRVLGSSGPLKVSTSEFSVQEDGTLVDNNTDKKLGTLLITEPAEGTELEKLGNGMFRVRANGEMTNSQSVVLQNILEVSNVDFNQEYTSLMAAQRAFQSCSSALQIADELNQKAAAQIASL